jgi:hypothetical protein
MVFSTRKLEKATTQRLDEKTLIEFDEKLSRGKDKKSRSHRKIGELQIEFSCKRRGRLNLARCTMHNAANWSE